MGQAITGSACRQWGARRFRKSLRDKDLGARGKVETGGSESATQGNRQKRVCRGWDSIVRRSSAAAIQGKLEKRVCRGWDERMKQGKNQEREQKKRNQKEEPRKRKTTRQYRGESDTGGWEDSSLTLRMTAESRDRSQNDSWVER